MRMYRHVTLLDDLAYDSQDVLYCLHHHALALLSEASPALYYMLVHFALCYLIL